jgi:glyoxylase-like metal-dependent hydrolase (beta-lactamase superfamily II)
LRDAAIAQGGERARLAYPFAAAPETGAAIDIAPGVKWMRMPLGGPLGFINVWALKDEGGWAIIDTGMQTPETAAAWRRVFAEALGGEPVTRVLVTHMHPDHIGMAGWMTRRFECRMWISRLEYLMCRALTSDTGREPPEDGLRFYRAAGWDRDAVDTHRSRFGGFGKAVHALPDSFRRLSDGDEIAIGDHVWRVVVGSGHSPEHACLYCPELKLLISGDQVLPRISSNVSVFPTEPDGDPLTDWLRSLASIRSRVSDDVLVLPAHNDPFHGLHARLTELIGDHEAALAKLAVELTAPRRAVDLFAILFRRPITLELLGMATGEAVAHLNCLMGRGVAVRETDADGVDWYSAIPGRAAS